jgi:hypothetical protein
VSKIQSGASGQRSDEGAAEIDAPRFNPDGDERLSTSDVVIKAGSEWEGCRDGAQADESERLNCNFSYWEIFGADSILSTPGNR